MRFWLSLLLGVASGDCWGGHRVAFPFPFFPFLFVGGFHCSSSVEVGIRTNLTSFVFLMKKLPALVREESLREHKLTAGFLVPVPFRFWRNIAKTHTLIPL
jgi:hypothetical protein